MPKYSPTAIAYQESGLIKDRQAFVTPNDAFVELDNAYVWRGITKRRKGYETLGRLRRVLTTQVLTNTVNANTYDNGATDILTTLGIRSPVLPVISEPNAEIDCGSFIITFDSGGASETILTDGSDGTLTVTATNALNATGGTINYVTGMILVTFGGVIAAGLTVNVDFNYFPSLPSMGITQQEQNAINAEDTVFFDTKYAYKFSGTTFTEYLAATATTWNGGNTNFFWFTNYWNIGVNKLFWVTNFNPGATGNPIRYTDGTTWTDFLPALNAAGTTFLQQCLMLIPYRGRLVALNTYTGATLAGATQNYNQARWSQNGDPTDQVEGWRSDVKGRGGFLNAPTNEHIVSAGFIRDTLIVYFERSTWKLRYTGNEIIPFVWERINIELGAESTFSIVKFDKGVLAVGDKAIITCDGNYVERIDQNIPDEVFKIHNDNDGVKRVQGIRNFKERVVYWIFPDHTEDPIYPNRVLLYNYENKTWAFFRDNFTTIGTFQRTSDTRWSDLAGYSWQDYKTAWNAGRNQSQFPLIVAGNQQGFIQIFNQKVGNDASLHITSIASGTPPTITSPDHNLSPGEIIEINNIVGTTSSLNVFRYIVTNVTQNTFQIQQKPRFNISAVTLAANSITATGNDLRIGDLVQFENIQGTTELNERTGTVLTAGNTFTTDIDTSGMTAWTAAGTAENCNGLPNDVVVAGGSTYLGCGEIKKVSNFSIRSKKFNMLNQGRKTQLGYIDFLVDVTTTGQVSVPIFIDYNDKEEVNPKGGDPHFNWGITTQTQDFSTVNQIKEWHRMYCNVEGQFFQYDIKFDESQMISKEIQESPFDLNAMIIFHEKGARLVQ